MVEKGSDSFPPQDFPFKGWSELNLVCEIEQINDASLETVQYVELKSKADKVKLYTSAKIKTRASLEEVCVFYKKIQEEFRFHYVHQIIHVMEIEKPEEQQLNEFILILEESNFELRKYEEKIWGPTKSILMDLLSLMNFVQKEKPELISHFVFSNFLILIANQKEIETSFPKILLLPQKEDSLSILKDLTKGLDMPELENLPLFHINLRVLMEEYYSQVNLVEASLTDIYSEFANYIKKIIEDLKKFEKYKKKSPLQKKGTLPTIPSLNWSTTKLPKFDLHPAEPVKIDKVYEHLLLLLQTYVFPETNYSDLLSARSKILQAAAFKNILNENHILRVLKLFNKKLKILRFMECYVSSNSFKLILENFKHLEILSIENYEVTSRSNRLFFIDVRPFLTSGHLKNIQYLNLGGNSVQIPPKMGGESSNSYELQFPPNLIALDLSKNEFTSANSQGLFQNEIFSKIKELNLSGNKIHVPLQDNAKEGDRPKLRGLLKLDLSHNEIRDQGVNKLFETTEFPLLEELNLSNNKLFYISARGNFPRLRVLKLSNNSLDSAKYNNFFGEICKEFSELEYLDLENNKLINPFQGTTNMRKLKRLNLSSNLIGSTSCQQILESDCFENLEDLFLAKNTIDEVVSPKGISQSLLQTLKILDLSHNQISDSGPIFESKFENLKVLMLNHNNIFNPLSGHQNNLISLRRLNLSNNKIMDWGTDELFKSIGDQTRLELLDLSCNKLKVPYNSQTLADYKNIIECINLNYNQMECAGAQSLFASQSFQALKKLTMVGNKIKVPLKVNNLLNLEILSLASNKISSEGSQLILSTGNINSLKEIDFFKNFIEEPCNRPLRSISLTSINIALNKVSEKGIELFLKNADLPSLSNLDLNGNTLKNISASVENSSFQGLTHMTLQNCGLTSTDSQQIFAQRSFRNLNLLNLSSNQITTPLVLGKVELTGLQDLDISYNKIDSEGCQSLFECSHLRTLSSLKLQRNEIQMPIKNLSGTEFKLAYLNLSHNKLNSHGSQSVFTCEALRGLKKLYLNNNGILHPVGANPVKTFVLETLLLSNNKINDLGSKNFFDVKCFNKLSYLDISYNAIYLPFENKTEGFGALAELNLESNKITGDGAMILLSNADFQNLLILNLSDNFVDKLARNLSEVKLPRLTMLKLLNNSLPYEYEAVLKLLSQIFEVNFTARINLLHQGLKTI